MKYEKPQLTPAGAVTKAVNSGESRKNSIFIETLDPRVSPSASAYEADE